MKIDRDLQIAFARHNAGIARARRARDYVIDPTCRSCTDTATCGDCRYEARLLLKVATSIEECAALLEIIDLPSPAAAQCGSIGGYKAHRRRTEKPCEECRRAELNYRARLRREKREGAV